MSEPILLDIHQTALRVVGGAVDSLRTELSQPVEAAKERARMAHHFNEIVQLVLSWPHQMQEIVQKSWSAAVHDLLDDWQAHGQRVARSFDETVLILETIRDFGQILAQQKLPVANLLALGHAVDQLREIREAFVRNWPWLDEQAVTEPREMRTNGEFLELDEAFAAIAGIDKETWLKRVQEYQQRKHP